VSGAAPETERERQLRAFASRLLAWPDPQGPSSVELLPAGYPDDVPSELIDSDDLRFLGSAVRRRGDELVNIELLFERAGGTNEILKRYEQGLSLAGWQPVNQPGLHQGGFEASGRPLTSVMVHLAKRTHAYIQVFAEDERSLLRVLYHGQVENLEEDPALHQGVGRSPLPGLRPPPGVRMRSHGSGGGGGRWASEATAHTGMPPMELEAYLAKQLEAAGWARIDGSTDEFFAWSSWLVPFVPPTLEWRGTLIVLAAFAGQRILLLRAEGIAPPLT
jgi:hypothetical protein